MTVTTEHLNLIVQRAREFGARRLILFGSALETPNDARDIDLAADIPGLALYAFAERIEQDLRCPVDVIPLDVRNRFIETIERRGKVLYDAR